METHYPQVDVMQFSMALNVFGLGGHTSKAENSRDFIRAGSDAVFGKFGQDPENAKALTHRIIGFLRLTKCSEIQKWYLPDEEDSEILENLHPALLETLAVAPLNDTAEFDIASFFTTVAHLANTKYSKLNRSNVQPHLERIQFSRLKTTSSHSTSNCEECNASAEFEYKLWCGTPSDGGTPNEVGILCGACAALILVQETKTPQVVIEKFGRLTRATR